MRRRARALWLPVVAVLLPCGFIAALAVEWLALERESASRRTEVAARTAVARVAQALLGTLVDVAPVAARAIGGIPESPPFAIRPLPSPVSAAFLFDQSGVPLNALRKSSQAEAREAAVLVERTTTALAARQWDAADRAAKQVAICCRTARDEYGVAYLSYAAWQRAKIYGRQPDKSTQLSTLAREVQSLIDDGYLATSEDVMHVRLLAEQLRPSSMATDLVTHIEQVHANFASREKTAQAAALWLATTTEGADREAVVIGALRKGATELAALWRAPNGDRLVVIIEPRTLSEWLAQLSHGDESQIVLASTGTTPDARTLPLFPDIPTLQVTVRGPRTDPAMDRRREFLFMAAAGGALLLTLAVGYLALRDVSRELSVASLRGTFIAGVTHELKTPLTSIRLLAETLHHDRVKPEGRAELLETMVHETERLSEIVDNVLSSSRIESGTRTYHPKPVAVADAVGDVLQRFDYVRLKEGFSLEPRISDSRLNVTVDPDGFAQALLNLLSNAVKYSGTSREIKVVVASDGGEVVISVADRGIGISDAEQRRIFDSFYRVPDAANEVAGAGLGLSLVRHFAEAHGGRVTVQSRSGEGSTFSLCLPLTPQEAGSSVPANAHG